MRTDGATGADTYAWIDAARRGDTTTWNTLTAYNEDDVHALRTLRKAVAKLEPGSGPRTASSSSGSNTLIGPWQDLSSLRQSSVYRTRIEPLEWALPEFNRTANDHTDVIYISPMARVTDRQCRADRTSVDGATMPRWTSRSPRGVRTSDSCATSAHRQREVRSTVPPAVPRPDRCVWVSTVKTVQEPPDGYPLQLSESRRDRGSPAHAPGTGPFPDAWSRHVDKPILHTVNFTTVAEADSSETRRSFISRPRASARKAGRTRGSSRSFSNSTSRPPPPMPPALSRDERHMAAAYSAGAGAVEIDAIVTNRSTANRTDVGDNDTVIAVTPDDAGSAHRALSPGHVESGHKYRTRSTSRWR